MEVSGMMESHLNSPPLGKRSLSTAPLSLSAMPAAPATQQSSGTVSPRRRKMKEISVPAAAPRLRRTLSIPRGDRELLFEIFFHIPGFSGLQTLRAHRSLSLVSLQAMLQREFAVPFEDQRLYFHGDLLEGDEELTFYEIQDHSVINVRISKRYRSIGDVFTKIKVIRFPAVQVGSTDNTTKSSVLQHDDYELIEVVAALPPLPILLRRLGIAVTYITMLDRRQQKRTNRRVWREHVNFWEEEPVSARDSTKCSANEVGNHASTSSSTTRLVSRTFNAPLATHVSVTSSNSSYSTGSQNEPASFVVRKCSPERVSSLMSSAHAHSIHKRLRIPPESRSAADVRHIRMWLGSVKYFANANMPDPALHEIARSCVYERHKSGDFIFRQGDLGDFFYILISGSVSLAAYGNGYFATMTPGMCFGEISLFEAGGVRTASANVNFVAPFAELAVLSGDVYRRVINPHKQAVLCRAEKAVYSVPQFRLLPDHIITHIAYASKCLTAKTGKRLIRRGDEVNVLVLLIAGAVKVSTPQPKHQSSGGGGEGDREARNLANVKPCFDRERPEKSFAIVSVIHAPAVFGQERCLTNSRQAAPWDIDALDTCSLICLQMDTVSVFLAPHQDIIRALMSEHQTRIEDFRRRFEQYAPAQALRRSSVSSGSKQASYLRLLSPSRRLLSEVGTSGEFRFAESPRMQATSRVEFSKVLMKDKDAAAIEGSPTLVEPRSPKAPASDARQGKQSALRSFFFGSRKKAASDEQPALLQVAERSSSAPTCAELQDQLLHCTLPYQNMLSLHEQIQFVSFAQQQADWDRQQHEQQRRRRRPGATEDVQVVEEPLEAKTRALLNGLRKLQAEDVKMAPSTSTPRDQQQPQFHFVSASS